VAINGFAIADDLIDAIVALHAANGQQWKLHRLGTTLDAAIRIIASRFPRFFALGH
jgi:hypothetical protein